MKNSSKVMLTLFLFFSIFLIPSNCTADAGIYMQNIQRQIQFQNIKRQEREKSNLIQTQLASQKNLDDKNSSNDLKAKRYDKK